MSGCRRPHQAEAAPSIRAGKGSCIASARVGIKMAAPTHPASAGRSPFARKTTAAAMPNSAVARTPASQAALSHNLILSVQVLQVSVCGRTLSKASYFLRKCGSSPVKVANS